MSDKSKDLPEPKVYDMRHEKRFERLGKIVQKTTEIKRENGSIFKKRES
jgi:hypothetical protein